MEINHLTIEVLSPKDLQIAQRQVGEGVRGHQRQRRAVDQGRAGHGREKGGFVTMPREQSTKDKKWYDTLRSLSSEVNDETSEKVLEACTKE